MLNMCKYCKNQGMTIDQYELFKLNIYTIAVAIRSQLEYNNGIYYPVSDIIKYDSNDIMYEFIIHELKTMDIEFFDNCTLYRIVD